MKASTKAGKDFMAKMAAARLTPAQFLALIEDLGVSPPSQPTISRWSNGVHRAPPCALALLTVVAAMTPDQLSAIIRALPKLA